MTLETTSFQSAAQPVNTPVGTAFVKQLPVGDRQYSVDENPQISILELMILTGSIAGAIAAISQLGMIGTSIIFFLSISTSAWLRVRFDDAARLRFWNQFLWGVLMPVSCVFGDPFILGTFQNGRPVNFNPVAIACYVFMIWQIQLLMSSWFITQKYRRLNAFLGGTFLAGALFALLVAICLIPLTIIGMLALIGILGLTPWFTANVYYRTGRMHISRSRSANGSVPIFYVMTGAVIAWALLVLLFVLTRIGIIEPLIFNQNRF